MSQKEQLEESRMRLQKLLRDSHVTEQIQQKEQLTQQIGKNLDVQLEFKHTKLPVVITQGKLIVVIV